MEEWKECKLSDIVEINPTESLKKGTVTKKIGMDVLQPYCRAIPSFSFEPYTGGTKFKNGDTIMARITPCLENGKTAMVNILDENEIGFGSTEYIVFRAKNNITDPYFVYYLVTSDCIRNPAIKSMVGSSGRQRVQTDVVANLSVKVPPLPTQQKIAAILSSLDDKIELNNKINTDLEQQAQALFKNWFVDDASELIENEIGKMDILITDYVANGSFKDLADNVKYLSNETDNVLIRLTDYNNNFSSDMVYISDESYNFLEKSKLFGDEIIISNVGANVGTVFHCPRLNKKMSLAPNSIMIRGGIYEHYLYLYFTSNYGQGLLKSIVTGSAQPKFNKTNFRSLKIKIPREEKLKKFNSVYDSLYEKIINNQNKNIHLTSLRNTLLPKVMNGEIEVGIK